MGPMITGWLLVSIIVVMASAIILILDTLSRPQVRRDIAQWWPTTGASATIDILLASLAILTPSHGHHAIGRGRHAL